MSHRKTRSFRGLWASVIFFSTLPLTAQLTANDPSAVSGMTGQVSVVPNPSLQEVFIEFTSNAPISSTSNQNIFALQGEFAKFPAKWTGAGRILVSGGIVIVVPSDNGEPTLAFRLTGRTTPDSVKNWSMDTYDVYGIGRFGGTTPLTQAQITDLETTGKFKKTASPTFNSNTADAQINGGLIKSAEPDGNAPLCNSGGRGATSCSDGGNSVTCAGGYYACCTGGSCTCIPN